jgi:hypothetical protein
MSQDDRTQALYQKDDRVRVSTQVVTSAALPSYVGTIRKVVPSYADQSVGYEIALDKDSRATRTWFFLQDELKPVAASRKTGSGNGH